LFIAINFLYFAPIRREAISYVYWGLKLGSKRAAQFCTNLNTYHSNTINTIYGRACNFLMTHQEVEISVSCLAVESVEPDSVGHPVITNVFGERFENPGSQKCGLRLADFVVMVALSDPSSHRLSSVPCGVERDNRTDDAAIKYSFAVSCCTRWCLNRSAVLTGQFTIGANNDVHHGIQLIHPVPSQVSTKVFHVVIWDSSRWYGSQEANEHKEWKGNHG